MTSARACEHCGAALEDGSLFCGTCGRSTTPGIRPDGSARVPAPPLVEPPRSERVRPPSGSAAYRPPARSAPADPGPDPTTVPGSGPTLSDHLAPPDRPARLDPSGPSDRRGSAEAEAPVAGARSEPLLPVPGGPPPSRQDPIDLEKTIVSGPGAPRFVLQFSTGESVTVRGEGLVGRAPVREPGEAVDQLIALADAGRSVSKTHLGFGQDRGRFWVSDRFSTNGTVVRPPDEPARRCEPGRRYLVSRGTRVDIGDQFFVVS